MLKRTLVGLVLASTFALTACNGASAPNGTAPGAASSQGSAGTAAELAAAMAEDREADDYDAMAEEDAAAAGYALRMVGAAPPPEGMMGITAAVGAKGEAKGDGKAGKGHEGKGLGALFAGLKADVKATIKAAQKANKARRKARLDKFADAMAKVRAELAKADWVDNGDGTKTKAITFDVTKTVNGQAVTKQRTITRTIDADGTLLEAEATFSHTAANGATHTATRTKTLQDDGSYRVKLDSTIALKSGGTRVVDWDKTIAADGTVSGTGTVVWKNAAGAVVKTVTVTLSGTRDAEVCKAGDVTVTAPVDAAVTATATGAAVPLSAAEDGTIESQLEVETAAAI